MDRIRFKLNPNELVDQEHQMIYQLRNKDNDEV